MSLDLSSKSPQINLKMREISEQSVFEFEDFRLDAAHLLVFREGRQLPLTPKVVETLLALVERNGEVVSKDALMQIVWPDTVVEESNLSQNIYILRKALGKTRQGGAFIETLKRRGYRFSPDVIIRSNTVKTSADQRPLKLERSENIYSVADWGGRESEPAADSTPPEAGSARSRSRLLFAVIGLIVAAGSLIAAAAWLNGPSPPAASQGLRELTFTPLTNGKDVNDVTISPDGKTIAYHEIDGDVYRLWLQQVGESARIELIPQSKNGLHSKTFSPDGQTLYFVGSDGSSTTSLFRVPTLGGTPVRVAENVTYPVAVSPDGETVALVRSPDPRRSSIVFVNSGGADRTVFTTEEGRLIAGGVAWSADGRTLAFGQLDTEAGDLGGCTLLAFDVETGSVRELSPEKWDNCGRPAWTDDGKSVLMIGTKFGDLLSTRRDQLYQILLDTGQARRLTTDGNRHQVASLGVSRNNEVVIVPFNRSSQVWIMNSNGDPATARQITNGTSDGRSGLAFLPDGRVAFTGRMGDNIHIFTVNADGADVRQITSDPKFLEEMRVSPDGKYFYFSAYFEGHAMLFRCRTDGSELTRVASDDTFTADSTISPDGQWIVYGSVLKEQNSISLRAIPSTGGKPFQLTEFVSETPHFSPDGRYVSFVDPNWKLGVVTFPEGKLVSQFDIPATTPPRLNVGSRWTPDGSALSYITIQTKVGNIWLQPLDGSPARPLTDFTSGEIHNYSFSPDGSKLALARGYPIKDAVLVNLPD